MVLGCRREQYKNVRNLLMAPKTKETYEQIIVAYIKGAADFFNDLSELCTALERRNAHINSAKYAEYEYINTIRHANPLNRYDEYVNEMGWTLKKIGSTCYGVPEEKFNILKSRILMTIVETLNPSVLEEASKRMRINCSSNLSKYDGTSQENLDIMYELYHMPPTEENLQFILGIYDGYVSKANELEILLQNFDVTGLNFDDSRIDKIIELSIMAAKARARVRSIKDLLKLKFGDWVCELNTNKIENKNLTDNLDFAKKIS